MDSVTLRGSSGLSALLDRSGIGGTSRSRERSEHQQSDWSSPLAALARSHIDGTEAEREARFSPPDERAPSNKADASQLAWLLKHSA